MSELKEIDTDESPTRKPLYAGSVYEDEKTLYLQLELKGRVLSFETPLIENESRMKLIKDMLKKESSKKILSVAFENYNLYYYCNREVDAIEQHKGRYKKWFNHCKDLRELDSEDKIIVLKQKMDAYNQSNIDKEDRLSVHTLTQITRIVDNKLEKIHVARAAALAKKQRAIEKEKLAEAKTKEKQRLPKAIDKAKTVKKHGSSVFYPVETRSEAASISMAVEAMPTPVKLRKIDPVVNRLKSNCQNPAKKQESIRKEADGTLLYKLGLYAEAVTKYKEAIQADCKNAKGWANLGVLYTMADDESYRDIGKAIALLTEAAHIKKEAGWIQHNLCIAEAYELQKNAEKALNQPSCQNARSVEPANAVLYDKLYYLAMADKYFRRKEFDKAFPLYEKSIRVDRRADCHMFDVMVKLNAFEGEAYQKKAEQASCEVLQQAYFLENNGGECKPDLKLLKSKCVQ